MDRTQHTYQTESGIVRTYELKRSRRRTIGLKVDEEAGLLVNAPFICPIYKIEEVLRSREGWIVDCFRKMEEAGRLAESDITDQEWEKLQKRYKRYARQVLLERTEYYARLMGVSYNKVTIKDMKTRWGSCSSEGNISYHWRLILAPAQVMDYIVVHELCHRKHMDHSADFWLEGERVLPDYRERRKWLKAHQRILSLVRSTETFKGETEYDFYL